MQTIIAKHFKFNYNTLVKRVKYRTGNNEADAEDVVMEAYVRAIQYKESFEMGSPFNLWFSRILSNCLKDWKREQFNQGCTESFDEEEVDPLPDPAEKKNLLDTLQKEIWAVEDENHREVLKLYYLYGFKLREVVQITNMKYQTANQIIHRFKNKMKEKHV